MRLFVAVACSLVVLIVITDVFNTIVLARRTRNSFRITRAVYLVSWKPYAFLARRIQSSRFREMFLGVYGPLALVTLFALWAVILIAAFGGLQWAAGLQPANMKGTVGDDLFLSASTFITLDSGSPRNTMSRLLTVAEAGLGFSLLGLVVGYLPVFYEAFAQRELQIFLLDARAGSPPSALELLKIPISSDSRVERYLEHWEKWAAQILENQLSFPMLAWFRSHHGNQSWLTALAAMTDTTTVISICAEGGLKAQAEFTFAMARHALVDVAAILRLEPCSPEEDRLNGEDLEAIRQALRESRLRLKPEALSLNALNDRRAMYEPYAHALSSYLLMALPGWSPQQGSVENWRKRGMPRQEVSSSVSDPFRVDSDL
jgi:hypothetical protein